MLVPAMLAGGVVQINLLIGRQVASFFEGAVAWLWYADRVFQLPLGVVGVAVGGAVHADDDRVWRQHVVGRAAPEVDEKVGVLGRDLDRTDA